MKIQIVSDLGPPVFGGAETYVMELGKELIKMKNEVYWNHMKISNAKYYEKIEGINCYRSWVPLVGNRLIFARLLYSIFMFPQVLRISKRTDVIQFNSFVAAVTGWIAGKFSKKPYLLMVHEFFGDLWNIVGKNYFEKIVYPEVEKFISKSHYPQIICPSNYTKNILVKLGVDEKIINVIYHGINHSIFHPGYEPVLKKKFPDKFIIGWAGRIGLSRTKNLKTLLEAFKIVKNEISNSILAFDGSNFNYLIPTIKKVGLELNKDVIYTGKSLTEELPYFYSSCDIFATSSLSEGFGLSAVEAQACGVPVVCFNTGALPEVVKDDVSGILVKDFTPEALAEGIIKILQDEDLRLKLSKNAQEWSKSFTWRDSAIKHLEVYEKCIELSKNK
ncbi:MAG: glycosyltransferase family 4 protein [Candidatus Aenigmatarchaeota archaeon]